MADYRRTLMADRQGPDQTSDKERERVRDQAPEGDGGTSGHNREYQEAVEGAEESSDVDPDSAEADVDRDDSVDDR